MPFFFFLTRKFNTIRVFNIGDEMILGKCPYCDDGQIEVRDKEVSGKKVKLYACSNASWKTEDGEVFELTENSSCDFKIWQNSLAKYGKWLQYKDVRALLNDEELEV